MTVPLAPRTARAIDLAVGERAEGPIFLSPSGERLDRHGARRMVRRIARRAGITKPVGPHTLRHAFITAALDAGVPLSLDPPIFRLNHSDVVWTRFADAEHVVHDHTGVRGQGLLVSSVVSA